MCTDATGGGVLGAVCVPPPPFRPAWVRAVIPPELTSLLRPRLTQVGPYEALAIVLALSAFADRGLEDADILLFVDNTEAQSIAINGFASAEDTALIAGDIWTRILKLRAAFWAERVASKSNPADAPTRMSDFLAGQRGDPDADALISDLENAGFVRVHHRDCFRSLVDALSR